MSIYRLLIHTAIFAGLLNCTALFAAFPPSSAYPPAAEDPVVDGTFTTSLEYAAANKVADDLGVGYFYKEHRVNWAVNGITYANTLTLFDNHHFEDPGYAQLDDYDMNSWSYKWGNTEVQAWVFLPGDNPADGDHYWLDMSEVGSANYPAGFDDNGGFLVRLNGDPSTDKIWKPGDPRPGDPTWKFEDYYGVFAYGGFNDSGDTQGYTSLGGPREMYEWSITLNRTAQGDGWGGIPGVALGGGEDNPFIPSACDPIWELKTKWKKVKDWKPRMGGFGRLGGIGYIPDGTEWVLMGFDDSAHPTPEPASAIILCSGVVSLLLRRRA